ncbi:MAG: hypothetical protein JXJ04_01455 [Spirochaetales bacterium]|nr:hypothetical protein [Spirochaetales bacterium]
MQLIPQAAEYIIFIICLIVSPIEDSHQAYIDGIELANAEISSIEILHDSSDSSLHFYYNKTEEDVQELFAIDKKKENTYLVKLPDGDNVSINLADYIPIEMITALKNMNGVKPQLAIDVNHIGKVYLKKIGEVTYVFMESGKEVMFVIH